MTSNHVAMNWVRNWLAITHTCVVEPVMLCGVNNYRLSLFLASFPKKSYATAKKCIEWGKCVWFLTLH